MLVGAFQVKFTSGHRLAVPASLRKDLGDHYILAKWYEGCLVLVGKDSWDALLTRITGGQKMIVSPVRNSERFIFASAYEVEPDDQGRIIIPDRLITYAGFADEVYFLGVNDRVEIWNKSQWDESEREVSDAAGSYIDELAKSK